MSPEKQIENKELVSDINKDILHKLKPETVEILGRARKIAGIPIRLEWGLENEFDRGDFGNSGGVMDGSWIKDFCLIKCNPECFSNLNHIVAHESLHILRQRQLPFNEYKVAVALEQNVWRAWRTRPQILDEIIGLIKQNFRPALKSYDYFSSWVKEIIQLLGNMPEDIQIESFIWENYKFLHEEQLTTLVNQTWGTQKLFSEFCDFKHRSPPTLYSLWLSLQTPRIIFAGALFKGIMGEKLLPELDFFQKSKGLKEFETGREFLLEILKEDNGLLGSYTLIDYWGKRLGIEGWYTWVKPEEIKNRTKD
jgi:hypothetical protein